MHDRTTGSMSAVSMFLFQTMFYSDQTVIIYIFNVFVKRADLSICKALIPESTPRAE